METRMLLVEDDMAKHEQVCGERWKALNARLAWGGGVALSIVLALASWGLNKTWDAQQQQMLMLREMQRQAVAVAH